MRAAMNDDAMSAVMQGIDVLLESKGVMVSGWVLVAAVVNLESGESSTIRICKEGQGAVIRDGLLFQALHHNDWEDPSRDDE